MSSLASTVMAHLPTRLQPARSTASPSGTMSWISLPPSAHDASAESVLAAFASLPEEQALQLLQSHVHGLSDAEVHARRIIKGANILPTQKPPSWILTLLAAIPNPFNVLLIFLAIISASVPDRDWVSARPFLSSEAGANVTVVKEGVTVLLIMVLISVLVRFWQEFRSSLAVFRLQSSITNAVEVRRQSPLRGRGLQGAREPVSVSVMEKDLVPGEVIVLSPGSIVPADCLVLKASFLRISQSTWTGENEPVVKTASPPGDKEATLFDLPNLAFMGTSVISGNGLALVLRTGRGESTSGASVALLVSAHPFPDVLIAGMAKQLEKRRERNSFERGIRNVSWMLMGFMCVMVPIVSSFLPVISSRQELLTRSSARYLSFPVR